MEQVKVNAIILKIRKSKRIRNRDFGKGADHVKANQNVIIWIKITYFCLKISTIFNIGSRTRNKFFIYGM